MFFHWVYTYALDTLGVGMTAPPADYQLLQYVPYIIIAIIAVAIWGPEKLVRKEQGTDDKGRSTDHDHRVQS